MENTRRTTRGRVKKTEESTMGVTAVTTTTTTKSKKEATTSVPNTGGKRSAAVNIVSAITNNKSESSDKHTTAMRQRSSPARTRSSRPSSAVPSIADNAELLSTLNRSPDEEDEDSSQQTNLPLTLTTNTPTLAPKHITSTSSVQSSYSVTTQQTIEIQSSNAESGEVNQLAEYIRRSVSRGFSRIVNPGQREGSFASTRRSNAGNRFSRSLSRSVYEEEYSDSEIPQPDNTLFEDVDEPKEEPFRSCNTTTYKRNFLCRQLPIPREFGGCLGISLLLVFTPLLVYYLQWCCSTKDCTLKIPEFKMTHLNIKALVTDVFYGPAVGAYLTFIFGAFVLSAILPGYYVRFPDTAGDQFNALALALLAMVAFGVAEYSKYPVAEFIIKHYGRFGIYGVLNSYFVALWAYFDPVIMGQKNETQRNVYGKTGNFVVDYALGRQLNPKWLNLIDFKQAFYRASLISTLLFSVSLMFKNIHLPWLPNDKNNWDLLWYLMQHMKYDPVALLSSAMLALYVLDAAIFEHHLVRSFELKGEGFGCLLLLRYALTPYLLSALPKYFFLNRSTFKSCFVIYAPLFLFCVGLSLKRYSSWLKYKYRVKPYFKFFTNVETIHTYQGRRLLLYSVWAWVRQPNYLGDILALLAMCLPLTVKFAWPPLLSVSLLIMLLIHRCVRVNARNWSRYHSSWALYCSNVRYYLIPKVF